MSKLAANPEFYFTSASVISSGGLGYVIGDRLGIVGGTSTITAVITVSGVSAGAITAFTITTPGDYSVLPTNPVALTPQTGTGTGATITALWVARNPGNTSLQHYGTNVAGVLPTVGSLQNRELFIDTATPALYTADGTGVRRKLVGSLGAQDSTNVVITGGTVNLPNFSPTDNFDVATKTYVDSRIVRNILPALRLATTVDLGASWPNVGLPFVDGSQTLEGERILVWSQTNTTQNGVYNATLANTGWTRTTDANTGTQFNGMYVLVIGGAANAGATFVQTTPQPITIGVTPIVFQTLNSITTIPVDATSGLFYNTGGRLSWLLPGSPTGGQAGLATAVDQGDGTTAWRSVRGVSVPVLPTDITNKQYVDGIASGVSVKTPVLVASTDDLIGTWTYNNGVAGVGATFTGPINQALTVDGITLSSVASSATIMFTIAAGGFTNLANASTLTVGFTVSPVNASARLPTSVITAAIPANSTSATVLAALQSILNTNPIVIANWIVSAISSNSFTLTSITQARIFDTVTITYNFSQPVQSGNVPTINTYTGAISSIGQRLLLKNQGSEALVGVTVSAGGSGYTVNDILTVVGGSYSAMGAPSTIRVTSVAPGTLAVTGVTIVSPGNYDVSLPPLNADMATGGTGTGALFNLVFGSNAYGNGIYTFTRGQTAALGVIITRAVDANTWALIFNSQVNVTSGNTLAGTSWVADVISGGTLGTTDITYTTFGTGQVLTVPAGGTGRSTLATGGVLVGNGLGAVYSDATNFYWNPITSRLGLGTTTPAAILDVRGSSRLQQVFEGAVLNTTPLIGTVAIDCANAAVVYFTATSTGNFVFNFRGSSTLTLENLVPLSHSITVAILTTQGATPYYLNAVAQIDGITAGVTTRWAGASGAPTFGNASSTDIYTFSIIHTAMNTWTVFANRSQYTA